MGAAPLTLAALALCAALPAARARAADPFERPFGPRSPWNVALPAGTTYSAVPGLDSVHVGLSNWLLPDKVSITLAWAGPSDPVAEVLYVRDPWPAINSGAWRTSSNPPAVEAAIRAQTAARFPYAYHVYVSRSAARLALPDDYDHIQNPPDGPRRIWLPPGARPTGNADGHMVVFQPDGLAFESYGTVLLSDGTVTAQSYKLTDPRLAGDGFQNGVTASMIPVYAGLLRVSDVASGQIDHALKLLAPAALLAPSAAYPALAFDRGALTQDPPYSGTLPMGARLAIPPDLDLAGLGLRTSLGRMLARAAQEHGMIVVDQGGGGLTVVAERGLPPAWGWSPEAERDLAAIVAAARWAEVPQDAYDTSRQMVGAAGREGGAR